MKTIITLTALVISFVSANEESPALKEAKESLATSYKALRSYRATYEMKTETGKTGTVTAGNHFAAGWIFMEAKLNDERGQLDAEISQWNTPADLSITKFEAKGKSQITVHEGLDKTIQRIETLTSKFNKDGERDPYSYVAVPSLSKGSFEYGIGTGPLDPPWISKATDLIKITDEVTVLTHPELGEITIDRATGLIKTQVIKTAGGPRTMSLSSLQINLPAKSFAKKFKIKTDGIPRQDIRMTGISNRFLNTFFQGLIKDPMEHLQTPATLQEKLASVEDNVIEFFKTTPIREVEMLGKERLQPIVRGMVEKISQVNDITPLQVLRNAPLKKKVTKQMAAEIRRATAQAPDDFFVTMSLTKPLTAETDDEESRKAILDPFLTRCVLRAIVEMNWELYLKNLD